MSNDKLNFLILLRQNYQLNLEVISAILHSINYNLYEGANKLLYSLCRRFTSTNEKGYAIDVTPDLYIHPIDSHPLVIELKLSLKEGFDEAEVIKDQLIKYYRISDGWACDYNVSEHEVGLIIKRRHKSKIGDLTQLITRENIVSDNSFFILCSERVQDNGTYFISIELIYGEVRNGRINKIYKNNDYVNITNIAKFDYYLIDQPPTLPYLTNILWTKIFSKIKKVTEKIGNGRNYETWEVDIKSITELLRDMHKGNIPNKFQDRERTVPKEKWIREAMKYLEYLGHAKKLNNNTYCIKWKKIASDPQEYFEKKYINTKYYKKGGLAQIKLFET